MQIGGSKRLLENGNQSIQATKMKGKEKRKLMVQDLLLDGYTQEKIAEKLNVSISTIERDVKKLRQSNERWLEELFPKNMVHIFREGLEGIRKDMLTIREMLDDESVKNDIPLKLKILKSISELREGYLEMLSQIPSVWSVNLFAKKNKLKRNDGKRNLPIYGELRGHEYNESPLEIKTN